MDRISYAAGVRQRPVNLAGTPTFAPISDRGDGDLGTDVTSRAPLELDCQRTKCSFDLFDCTGWAALNIAIENYVGDVGGNQTWECEKLDGTWKISAAPLP